MNLLERIRSKFWSFRLLGKCRRKKLFCKKEKEERSIERERESEGVRHRGERVKGRR